MYGAARIGDIAVKLTSSPASSRWAIVLLSVAVLVLAGCGRKAGLDPPPNAPPQPSAAAQGDAAAAQQASQPSVFDPSYGANAPPVAAKGSKKPFALDPLLNSN